MYAWAVLIVKTMLVDDQFESLNALFSYFVVNANINSFLHIDGHLHSIIYYKFQNKSSSIDIYGPIASKDCSLFVF